ncbi:serine/threonine protein kinase [Kibdelosporangium philippinense]|uniref:non-specific serine/threonine protein kinase n=1 Tax=Kibdelosporangium philippinense TaxID=211113 RepID=A0ABS8ZTC6_9PSEU|nr:serine/threonine-protein kinase [Kibdelosporangium philippinense]MCE7010964.1 serine/threonine protein kinase [Kibdelosporangium philippinense]
MTDGTGMLVAQRYRLVRVIGAGGMGRVWLGHDELIGREVAIKELLLPPGLDDAQRTMLCERAMREARAAGRLNHPGIVTVHDVVQHNGSPMIVMEFVRGGSLSDAVRAQGPLPVEQVAYIGLAMLDALRVAHRAGIVHRDLKPANVLLTEDRVVITDFGIARLMGDVQLTTSGTIVGTPAYMAPEQGTGAPVTPASDFWSLGATLYAALEGRPPYDGPDFMATLSALLTRDPLPPTRAGRLTGLLNALLRKDPNERATAEQVATMLAGGDSGMVTERIHAPGIPPAKRGTSRRTMLLAGGAALVAIGASAAWILSGKEGEDKTPSNTANSTGLGGEESPARTTDTQAKTSAAGQPEKPAEITDHIQLTGHEDDVTSVAFSPDGKLLASGDDGLPDAPTARLWDAATGQQVATLVGPAGPGGGSVRAVAFSPDGKLLALGGNHLNESTRLWNVADRQLIGPLPESRSIMRHLSFSPDGKVVAGVTHGGSVKLWDVATRQVKIGLPAEGGDRNIVFSPDGSMLAYCGSGKEEVRIVDPATGRTIRSIDDATGSDISFSPDGKHLAVPDADGTNSLRVYDVSTGESVAFYDRNDDITLASVAYSPDGKTIAAWGHGNTIQLWDVATRRIRAVLIGSAGSVNTVVWDAAGTRIASGADDKIIRIWKLSPSK